jgi:hypothetical protein
VQHHPEPQVTTFSAPDPPSSVFSPRRERMDLGSACLYWRLRPRWDLLAVSWIADTVSWIVAMSNDPFMLLLRQELHCVQSRSSADSEKDALRLSCFNNLPVKRMLQTTSIYFWRITWLFRILCQCLWPEIFHLVADCRVKLVKQFKYFTCYHYMSYYRTSRSVWNLTCSCGHN